MIEIYFGLPRCGKTTLACYLAKKYVKEGKKVYINFPCKVEGTIRIQNDYIGKYDMENGVIIVDEASVFADSRDYKKFPKKMVEFFCLHGHWNNHIILLCQIYNRIDATIRLMTERLHMVRKGKLFRFMTYVYNVPYGFQFKTQDTEQHKFKRSYGDIEEGYAEPNIIDKITALRLYRPKYYKYFDTYEKPFELEPFPENGGRATP